MQRCLMIGMLVAILGAGTSPAEDAAKAARVTLTTSKGDITLELDSAKAPITVENFLAYVRAGYYEGTVFHRVIPGFMVQGGGLDKDLRDKVDGQRPPIKNEASNGLKNVTGTVAMARTSVPDSATSQFFVNVKDNAFLDQAQAQDGVGYAVFGKIVEGIDVVKEIEAVPTESRGMHRNVPTEPVLITKATIVGDPAPAPAEAPAE